MNNKGLIMSEMLLSLACLSIIAFLLAPAISVLESGKSHTSRKLQEMEWEIFYTQAKNELLSAASIQVLSGKLVFKLEKDTVMYEKYGNTIRRRVNLTGHEILLQNIDTVAFKREGQQIIMQTTDFEGNLYEGIIYSIIPWE
ncbi:hypothetical protein A8F94_04355 [Bacillus sp. FJAT-27225]|nr:hypothetical protein A8F94_04355 [Bacillus sp. FJAT-27225]